jgi:hypothetical protein
MMQSAAVGSKRETQQEKLLARRFAWAFGAAAVVLVICLVMMGTEWRDAMKNVVAKGRTLRALHYGQWGVWWGCAVDAVLCAGLALTSRWWGTAPAQPAAAPLARTRVTRGAWIALLIIIGVGGLMRWQRAGLSFYNDEAQAFRRFMGGQHKFQGDGTVKWHEPPWWETAWLNKSANNSMPYSLLARLSSDTWGRLAGAPADAVNERAVRLPVFVLAMAGLIVIWLVARRMLPGSSACWWVVLLAAVHPWHVRYSTEARGHGFLLLGVPLCFWFLLRALEDDRWRWWLGMGVAQFFCVWSFQGCVPFLAVFNGLLLAGMMWHAWKGATSWRRLSRPVLGMMVGAIITLPVMLPLMKQLAEAIPVLPSLQGRMGVDWWKDVASFMVAGIAWVDFDSGNAQNLALSRVVSMHPWVWLLVACALFGIACGIRRLWRCGTPGRLAVVAGPVAAAGMWAMLSRQGTFMYPWYLIFMLPGLLLTWGSGMASGFPGSGDRRLRLAVLAAMLLPIAGLGWADLHVITVPKENLRGLAEAIPASALHGSLFSDVDVYDGDVVVLDGVAKLDKLIERARAEEKSLYVSFSRRDQGELAPFYERVRDAGAFEHLADFPGQQDPQFTHHLYRLRR